MFNMVYLGLQLYGGFMVWLMRSMISTLVYSGVCV